MGIAIINTNQLESVFDLLQASDIENLNDQSIQAPAENTDCDATIAMFITDGAKPQVNEISANQDAAQDDNLTQMLIGHP